jgi:hypothetical protein
LAVVVATAAANVSISVLFLFSHWVLSSTNFELTATVELQGVKEGKEK